MSTRLKKLEKARKEMFWEKRLHWKFTRDVCEVFGERSWQGLRAGYLGNVFAAQEKGYRPWYRVSVMQYDDC